MKVTSVLLIHFMGLLAVIMATPIEKDTRRLIKISEQDPGTWMTEGETFKLLLNRKGFVDITDNRDFSLESVPPHNTAAIPTAPRFQTVVNDLIRTANQTRVEAFLRGFTGFFTRHYQSQSGLESEKWLLSQVMATLAEYRGNGSAREVEHSFLQNSIIARIDGVDPVLKDELVILGAHLDSTTGSATSRSPGADDNASGSAVVLEVFRVLVAAGLRPNRSIEFHWYAGEEAGLLGSADIAREYRARNASVAAMLNMDVVGWQPNNITEIAVFTDNGDAGAVQFVRVLTDEYLTFTRRDKSCGYACSDHASWSSQGYPSVFAAEAEGNPNAHRETDEYDTVGIQQVMEFVKLALGFAVEIGEPL